MRKPIFTSQQLDQATKLTMDSFRKFTPKMPPFSAFEEETAAKLASHWDGVEPAKLQRALALAFMRSSELRASFITACVVLHDRSLGYLDGLDWFANVSTEFAASSAARDEMIDILKGQIVANITEASDRARKAANALHDTEGGSRDLQRQVRDAWHTGNFPSRDHCAEDAARSGKISFSAARRALRNTPDPPNWKKSKKGKKLNRRPMT